MGWAMTVLMEPVMLPFESVEVKGTGIATGVVGKVVARAGEGVMTMLLDAGAGGFEMAGSRSLALCWIAGASGDGGLETRLTVGLVLSVGTIAKAAESA